MDKSGKPFIGTKHVQMSAMAQNNSDIKLQTATFEDYSQNDLPLTKTGDFDVEVETRQRDEWSNPIEFLFSCLSLSVGLGNIWRFPFTAYKNGGGAFLIPYLIVLIFIGRPIYFLELAWSQFTSYGQVKAWKAVPLLKGVGYGELIASICGGSYYCAIMNDVSPPLQILLTGIVIKAITIFYLIKSFDAVLPWTICNEEWIGKCDQNMTLANDSLPQLYYERTVVKQLENIDEGIGAPDLRLSLCLICVWVLIFLTLIKGIKSVGMASYFTALFPFFVLVVLLVRGVTLPGSWDGIRYFIEPKWEKILDLNVWYAAISQSFFSLSCGFGATMNYASSNSFSHKIYGDALIISFMDTFISLLAGFTVFATLGNLAKELNVDVSEVAKSGPGLAFISYPDAISKFDFAPQFFAVLFFLMLLTLGIGTATAMANGIVTVICDEFPKFRRIFVTIIVCIFGFTIGLIYVTPGGQFLITLVDHFGAGFIIYIMATLEVIGISWIYGLSNFCVDIEFMLKIKIGYYWRICWGFIIPISLVSILIYTLINSTTLTHVGVQFPTIALAFGWTLSGLAISIVPLCALQVIFNQKGCTTLYKKLISSLYPSADWGPRDKQIRRDWTNYKMNSV